MNTNISKLSSASISQIGISNLYLSYSIFCSTLSKTALFHQYMLNGRTTAICIP